MVYHSKVTHHLITWNPNVFSESNLFPSFPINYHIIYIHILMGSFQIIQEQLVYHFLTDF